MTPVKLVRPINRDKLKSGQMEIYAFWPSEGVPDDKRWGREMCFGDHSVNTADEGAMDRDEVMDEIVFSYKQGDLKELLLDPDDFRQIFQTLFEDRAFPHMVVVV